MYSQNSYLHLKAIPVVIFSGHKKGQGLVCLVLRPAGRARCAYSWFLAPQPTGHVQTISADPQATTGSCLKVYYLDWHEVPWTTHAPVLRSTP